MRNFISIVMLSLLAACGGGSAYSGYFNINEMVEKRGAEVFQFYDYYAIVEDDVIYYVAKENHPAFPAHFEMHYERDIDGEIYIHVIGAGSGDPAAMARWKESIDARMEPLIEAYKQRKNIE